MSLIHHRLLSLFQDLIYHFSTFEHVATTCVVPFLDTIPPTSYFKKGSSLFSFLFILSFLPLLPLSLLFSSSLPFLLFPDLLCVGDIAIAWRRVPNQIHLGNWFSVCIVDVSHDTNTVKGMFTSYIFILPSSFLFLFLFFYIL